MLKTNTKLVQQRIQDYVMQHFQPYEEDANNPAYNFNDYTCVCQYIWYKFITQAYNTTSERKWFKNNIQDAFAYWIGGLPSILNPAYMYQESAVDTLGDILEQTTAERRKYSEQQSEQTMTYLIYNSVRRHVTNPYG